MKRIFLCLALWLSVDAFAEEEALPVNPGLIEKAMASVKEAGAKVENDPNRPAYHIMPPGNWMNDPNGPIFHKGYWHMFYQHNPYGDGWGHMHWGHVRSRNLAYWEHMPIALWPSIEAGEEHVFSGSATINGAGEPMIFYTAIFKGKSAGDYAEQWAALGNEDLTRWRKHPANPILKPGIHGNLKVWDWRDPFLFKYQNADYMVLGGNLNKGKGGEGVVTLYKAENPELTNWKYVGILFTHPDPKVSNIECPNFFELDGKWVLILSPHRKVDYFVGSFDGKKFTAETQGLMDHSDNYYAPNCTTDSSGRRVLWGWVRGFKDGQGWNGCLTLPRVLSVDSRGKLRQSPAPELHELRSKKVLSTETKIGVGKTITGFASSAQVEIQATFWSGNKSGVTLFKNDEDPGLKISYEDGKLQVGERTATLDLGPNDPLSLHVFIDHSVTEVYANGKVCLTTVFYPKTNPTFEFFTQDPSALLEADIYELNSAWNRPQ